MRQIETGQRQLIRIGLRYRKISVICCLKAPVVGDILSCILQSIGLNSDTSVIGKQLFVINKITQRLSAIYISTLYLILVILFHEAFGSIFKSLYRSVVPPLMQISMQVVLPTYPILIKYITNVKIKFLNNVRVDIYRM